MPIAAHAQATLTWNPASDPTVTGYRLWWASLYDSTVPLTSQDVGTATSATIPSLPADTFYVFVTSYNAAGVNSDSSNEVVFTVPNPPAPVVIPGGAICITAGQTLQVGPDTWSLAPDYDGRFGFSIYRNGSYNGSGVVLFNQAGSIMTVNSRRQWYQWINLGWQQIAAPPNI